MKLGDQIKFKSINQEDKVGTIRGLVKPGQSVFDVFRYYKIPIPPFAEICGDHARFNNRYLVETTGRKRWHLVDTKRCSLLELETNNGN